MRRLRGVVVPAVLVLTLFSGCAESRSGDGAPTEVDQQQQPSVPELEPAMIIDVGSYAQNAAAGAGSIWVANHDDATVSRIDPETNEVATIKTGTMTGGIGFGFGSVWVSNYGTRFMTRINPRTNGATQVPLGALGCGNPVAIDGAIWTCLNTKKPEMVRVDPRTGRTKRYRGMAGYPSAASGSLWLVDPDSNRVHVVDPSTGQEMGEVAIDAPDGLVGGAGAIWVTTGGLEQTVVRVDPNTLTTTVLEPPDEFAFKDVPMIAADGDDVWVFDGFETIYRIDAASDEIIPVATIADDALVSGSGFAAAFGSLWISDIEAAAQDPAGFVLRFALDDLTG